MTMVMISPSEREVSLAEQLRQSPRLVPPMFRLVAAEFRLRRWLVIFFHRETPYSRRWPPESQQGPHEAGGRAPTLVGRWWPPDVFLPLSSFFIISKNNFCGVSGLLELCRIGP